MKYSMAALDAIFKSIFGLFVIGLRNMMGYDLIFRTRSRVGYLEINEKYYGILASFLKVCYNF